jgi:hypothetical protein
MRVFLGIGAAWFLQVEDLPFDGGEICDLRQSECAEVRIAVMEREEKPPSGLLQAALDILDETQPRFHQLLERYLHHHHSRFVLDVPVDFDPRASHVGMTSSARVLGLDLATRTALA